MGGWVVVVVVVVVVVIGWLVVIDWLVGWLVGWLVVAGCRLSVAYNRNLMGMASNPTAPASNVPVRASNLIAMNPKHCPNKPSYRYQTRNKTETIPKEVKPETNPKQPRS